LANIRESEPDSGLGFLVEVLEIFAVFEVALSSLADGIPKSQEIVPWLGLSVRVRGQQMLRVVH
jgi:hypothetical protein